jgi:hypothetical protein
MDMQGAFLSTTGSIDVQSVPLSNVDVQDDLALFTFLKFSLNAEMPGLSSILSVLYHNEQKFRCLNQSGIGIRRTRLVPE